MKRLVLLTLVACRPTGSQRPIEIVPAPQNAPRASDAGKRNTAVDRAAEPPPGSAKCPGELVYPNLMIDGAIAIASNSTLAGIKKIGDHDGATFYAADTGLWRVDCSLTPPAQIVLKIAAGISAFANATITKAAEVFYSDGSGVSVVALATGQSRKVYTSPTSLATKWIDCIQTLLVGQVPAPPTVIDRFASLADDATTLVLRRSVQHCPVNFEVRVTNYADAKLRSEHVARPIYSVAADTQGTLWMTDGGGLWRSTDRGVTWSARAVKLPRWEGPGDEGIAQVLIDAQRANHLIVRTASGKGVMGGAKGMDAAGRVARSRDGGRTWTLLSWGGDDDNSDARKVSAPQGNLDQLVLSRDDEERPVLTTTDGGKTWTDGVAPRMPNDGVPNDGRTVTIDADVFNATDDGLERVRAGKRMKVTKALVKPYPLDIYDEE